MTALERARALVEDLELAHVAAFKREHPGWLAVGTMPVYAPRPLLEACDCLPVAVFGGGDGLDIIRGDSYFQSYICRIPRSTIELALSGRLAALDGMIFPSTCDVIRNLSGMWKVLFPDRFAAYLDLPQNFDPASGARFYAGELARIASGLLARGAAVLDDGRLTAAIARENDRRAALGELDALRRAEPWRARASDAYLVARAGAALTAADHAALVRAYLAEVRAKDAREVDNVRVVVTGAFCEQPPLPLIVSLERAGCDIVDDDFQLALRAIEGPIEQAPGERAIDALARAFVERGAQTASRYIGGGVKGAALIERVRASGAEGVIFAAASFCDPALLDQPMLEAALDRAGVPHTSLKFAENTGDHRVIREQAGAFSDAVKLWGSAR